MEVGIFGGLKALVISLGFSIYDFFFIFQAQVHPTYQRMEPIRPSAVRTTQLRTAAVPGNSFFFLFL